MINKQKETKNINILATKEENKASEIKEGALSIDSEKSKILLKCEELQKNELEALKLIYVRDKELVIKNENNKQVDTVIHMELNDENINDNIINITFELPNDYPLKSFLIINVNVKNFTNDMNNYINQEIYKDMNQYLEQECSILSIIYKINELVENIINDKEQLVKGYRSLSSSSCSSHSSRLSHLSFQTFSSNKKKISDVNDNQIKDIEVNDKYEYNENINNDISALYYNNNMHFSPVKKILARRLCYSHHILSYVKRTYIIKWAKELKIGGYSKIGYPGIIICEGGKNEVDFYVNSLNKLRWKHFDCRGMEDIELNDYEDIDDMRVLPKNMYEIDPKGMSTLSNICTECGLRDLFLTSMKIYNAPEQNATNEKKKNEKNKNDSKKKKPKRKSRK
ncbi:conserved protein, unknown function [Hepatocystis sp. ex Piliocolobus tephrosceles]|nr:conserved protein, unknown function [Hepatocystis sp. ex Piliocolobus tephrosceles]